MKEPPVAITNAPVRTHPRPSCPVCGSAGEIRYSRLRDRLWQVAPGDWTMRSCPSCGCLWIDPVPDERDVGRLYENYYTHGSGNVDGRFGWLQRGWDKLADAYVQARLGYPDGVGRQRLAYLAWVAYLHPGAPDEILYRVLHLPAPSPGQRVLDVGCGNGDLLARLQARGWDAVGIDLDETAVRQAKSRGLDARVGQLADQHFPDASFDAITVSHVIEHTAEPGLVLKECARILRPGGRLVVLTPNPRSWGHARFGEAWVGLDPPRHLVLLNRDNLRSLADRAGLRILALRTGHRAIREQWWLSDRIKKIGVADALALRLRWQLRWMPAQYLVRIVRPFRPDAGEELILIATRGA